MKSVCLELRVLKFRISFTVYVILIAFVFSFHESHVDLWAFRFHHTRQSYQYFPSHVSPTLYQRASVSAILIRSSYCTIADLLHLYEMKIKTYVYF